MSGNQSEPAARSTVDELRAAEALAGGAGGAVAEFQLELSPLDRAQRWLHGHPTASPAIVLVLSFVYFSIATDRFFTTFNMSTILAQVVGVTIPGLTSLVYFRRAWTPVHLVTSQPSR